MITIGKYQNLKIKRFASPGAYLSDDETADVLLPSKQVPKDAQVGDCLDVFIYRDSDDRIIATTAKPLLTLGEVGVLTVKDVTKIGAFLDWGLEKDLFLPFKEQTRKLKQEDKCMVALYLDKSSRLCATMHIYQYLKTDSHYKVNDEVKGMVFSINRDYGIFVAVDNVYAGMIPIREYHGNVKEGDEISARVTAVREDGKLNLSLSSKAYIQMEKDAKYVKEVIESKGGVLNYGEKASVQQIEKDFGLSKAAFKRALSRLYKERLIEIKENEIRLKG